MKHVFLMLALMLVGPLCAKESFCYLGVEGGYITGMGRATLKRNVGPDAGILVAFNPIPRAGFDAGANLGVKLPCFLRTEVAYTFQHQSYDWKEFVGITPPLQQGILMKKI